MAFQARWAAHRGSRPAFDLDQIHLIPIATVARDLGFKLTERGSGLCKLPGHDDHNPSFSIRPTANRYRCFACNSHGDVIALAMAMKGVDFRTACQWLIDNYIGSTRRTAEPPPRNSRALAVGRMRPMPSFQMDITESPDPEVFQCLLDLSPLRSAGRAYLTNRGFSDETLQRFRVGQLGGRSKTQRALIDQFGVHRVRACGLIKEGRWGVELVFPSHYLLFPFLLAGDVVYLQARRPDQEKQFRWVCPAKLLPPVYNLDVLSHQASTIWVCEGVTDVLSAHELGMTAIGLVGASARIDDKTVLRLRGRNVAVLGDADAAGHRFAHAMVGLMGQHGITAVAKRLPLGVSDLNEHLLQQRDVSK